MNRKVKIRNNYISGLIISILLLILIYYQFRNRSLVLDFSSAFRHTGPTGLLIVTLLLVFPNLWLDALKWKRLIQYAGPATFSIALKSMLSGYAFSFFTPNRLGDYPGRILYLGWNSSFQLIAAAIAAALSQVIIVFCFTLFALLFFPYDLLGAFHWITLLVTILVIIFLSFIYFNLEWLESRITGVRLLRKWSLFRQLLLRISIKEKVFILFISASRFVIYNFQLVLLLRYFGLEQNLFYSFLGSNLFFGSIMTIPSVGIAEPAIRSEVGLFLFRHNGQHNLGIITAILLVWILNVVLPALVGLIFIAMRRWKYPDIFQIKKEQ